MKFYSIQFLRALAALLVVYHHSAMVHPSFGQSWQQHFFFLGDAGAIGVDIFFVISGFIIAHIAHSYSGSQQAGLFLKKRFLRINPVYYIASLIYLVIILLQLWINPADVRLSGNWLGKAVSNTLFILPLFSSHYSSPLLFVGWTLLFEWLFYCLFAVLILAKVKNKTLLLCILIPALAFTGYFARFTDIRLAVVTNPILIEFLFGVAGWWFYTQVKKYTTLPGYFLLFAGLAGFAYLLIYGYGSIAKSYNIITGELSGRRAVLWGIPSACLVTGSILLEKNRLLQKLWKNRLLQLSGDASFSIYITHSIVFHLIGRFYNLSGFLPNPDIAILVQVVIAVATGILFYKYIETPLLNYWKMKRTERLAPL